MTDPASPTNPASGADPIHDPFVRLQYIGAVVERFAALESVVRRTAWLLLHADPVVAHVLTTGASVWELLDLSKKILKESSRKGIERGAPELPEVLGEVKAIFNRRNDLLHNVQLPGEGFELVTWKYRRGQDKPDIIPAGTAEILQLWQDVDGVINRVVETWPDPPFHMPPHYI